MKRTALLSFALLPALLLPLFTSCGGTDPQTPAPLSGGETAAETAETAAEETALTDSLPALDFEGREVTFYSNTYHESYSPNFVVEQVGEALNDTRWQVESAIEERLNVVISETRGANSVDEFDASVKSLILAGDATYDLMTNMDRYMFADVTQGMFIATSDLPYVDLTAQYWNPEATAAFSVGGKIWYAMTSFNLYSQKNTSCVFMNLELAESLGIGAQYDAVRNGAWTFDAYYQLIEQGYYDVNGDGVRDANDRYGYSSNQHPKNTWPNHVIGSACHLEILQKDDSDYFTYGYSEKLLNVLEDAYGFYHDRDAVWFTEKDGEYVEFETGRALLGENSVGTLESDAVRDIEFRFSVLPIPKYDETQERYYCRTYDSFFTLAPVTNVDTEPAGAVLEALSCAAYNEVLPVYIDDTLKTKYARDEESVEMLGLILDSRIVMLAEAYMFDLYGNANFYVNFIKKPGMNAASYLDSIRAKTESKIDSFNTYFSENIG